MLIDFTFHESHNQHFLTSPVSVINRNVISGAVEELGAVCGHQTWLTTDQTGFCCHCITWVKLSERSRDCFMAKHSQGKVSNWWNEVSKQLWIKARKQTIRQASTFKTKSLKSKRGCKFGQSLLLLHLAHSPFYFTGNHQATLTSRARHAYTTYAGGRITQRHLSPPPTGKIRPLSLRAITYTQGMSFTILEGGWNCSKGTKRIWFTAPWR